MTLVGLDVGTTGVKAIAIDDEGEVVARAEESYELSTPQPGWAEQDPDDWVRAAEAALAQLDATAVGFSGQMHGLVALDADDVPLRPAILWNDQRTQAECTEIEATLGLDRLISLTGNRALTGFTAPKLLWLRRHEPDVYARIRSVLLPKDYVRLKLFGERAIDVADASGTLLFDVANRRWSEEVLAALDLPGEWLPQAYESPEIAGAGDQAAAALGVGVTGPGRTDMEDRRGSMSAPPGVSDLGGTDMEDRRGSMSAPPGVSDLRGSAPAPVSVVLGTSGVVFGTLDAFKADPQARAHVFCHAVPGTWHAMGVMLSAAGSLQWLRDAVAPGVPFDELVAEAERWPPGTEGLLFAPYLAGERTPHADPDARGAFVGLSLRHDRGALVRAVLEGVAYGLRDSLELLRELGVQPDVGRVSGGGARSGLWRAIVAAVFDLPLESTAAEDGSAYGAALLAGCRSGVFADPQQAVERCVRVHGRTNADPAWVDAYADGYARFRRVYPAIAPL